MKEDSIAQGKYVCPHSLNYHQQFYLLQPRLSLDHALLLFQYVHSHNFILLLYATLKSINMNLLSLTSIMGVTDSK